MYDYATISELKEIIPEKDQGLDFRSMQNHILQNSLRRKQFKRFRNNLISKGKCKVVKSYR